MVRKKRDSEGDMPVMFELQEDMLDEDGEPPEMTLLQWITANTEKELDFYYNACQTSIHRVRHVY